MDAILFGLNFAWKILALCMGWMLFRYVLKNGSETFKELLETIGIALKAFGHWIRHKCLVYLRKEIEPDAEEEDTNTPEVHIL